MTSPLSHTFSLHRISCATEKNSSVFIGLGAVAGLLLIVFVVVVTHSVLTRRGKKQRYVENKMHLEHYNNKFV